MKFVKQPSLVLTRNKVRDSMAVEKTNSLSDFLSSSNLLSGAAKAEELGRLIDDEIKKLFPRATKDEYQIFSDAVKEFGKEAAVQLYAGRQTIETEFNRLEKEGKGIHVGVAREAIEFIDELVTERKMRF